MGFDLFYRNEFSQKKVIKTSSYQCNICKKSFESEDYLEFHYKQAHHRQDNIQQMYETKGMICPADLCDIFECPEFSEKTLRL